MNLSVDPDTIGERPNSVPWPPLLLVAGIGGAFGMNAVWPWTFGVSLNGMFVIAALAFIFGLGVLALIVWAGKTMREARTTILPHKGSDALVTTGPFAWSRNPIYVADGLAFAALWAVTRSYWFLVFGVLVLVGIHFLAVKREEAHLRARFGDAWEAYAARVPQWIGWPKRGQNDSE